MKTKIYGEVEPIVELLSFAYPTTEIFKDSFFKKDLMGEWNNEDFDKLEKELK
jgi:hypothetical protein